jgi:hypothetical protein
VTTRRKPTAREAWEAIDDAAFKAEVNRIVAMSDEEVEAELLKDGFDPADLAESEKAPSSQVIALPAKAKTKTPTPIRRTRRAVLLAAATVGAMAAGVAVVVSNGGHSGGLVSRPRPDPRAEALREQGLDACSRREWRLCLQHLDEAKELDAEGDRAKSVQDARAEARQGLQR